MSRGLSRGFGVGGTWRFWSREGWEPVPLRGGPERYSAEPNTSERPMAKKNGFCQQLCIDGGYAALDRGLGLSPVRPDGFGKPPSVVLGPASAPWAPGLRAYTHCLTGICQAEEHRPVLDSRSPVSQVLPLTKEV